MSKPRLNPRAIGDARRIRVLASPVRHELVDTLSALGGRASVAQLAVQLGRPADGLYYHLRVLQKSGLVEELAEEAGERIYRLVGTGKAPLRLAYDPAGRGNLSALSSYARGLLKVAQRDFESGLRTAGVVMQGERRQLWAARNKGWVSAAELEEVNRLLERLCELTSRPQEPGRDMLMSLAFVLSPCARRPKRRVTPDSTTSRSVC
jgi:DNA-binding transcriptional ArsR family regulator